MSGSSTPATGTTTPNTKYALTPVERQRSQLDRLLKDPAKPAYVPSAPKEKALRPAREMMKNVQGSSAGAGSGEFHVYKASRRREYERLKLMEEESRKETETAEFEKRKREAEELTESKTAKNRAKRQKKKERAKGKSKAHPDSEQSEAKDVVTTADIPLKKRRLVNGKELVFRQPGQDSDDSEAEDGAGEERQGEQVGEAETPVAVPVVESKIIIHEDN